MRYFDTDSNDYRRGFYVAQTRAIQMLNRKILANEDLAVENAQRGNQSFAIAYKGCAAALRGALEEIERQGTVMSPPIVLEPSETVFTGAREL